MSCPIYTFPKARRAARVGIVKHRNTGRGQHTKQLAGKLHSASNRDVLENNIRVDQIVRPARNLAFQEYIIQPTLLDVLRRLFEHGGRNINAGDRTNSRKRYDNSSGTATEIESIGWAEVSIDVSANCLHYFGNMNFSALKKFFYRRRRQISRSEDRLSTDAVIGICRAPSFPVSVWFAHGTFPSS